MVNPMQLGTMLCASLALTAAQDHWTGAKVVHGSGLEAHAGSADAWVQKFVKENGCVVFGMDGCQWCTKAKELYKSKRAAFGYRSIDDNSAKPSGQELYQALVRLTRRDTFPNIWMGGKFLGGFSELDGLNKKGKLDAALAAADCVKKPTKKPTKKPSLRADSDCSDDDGSDDDTWNDDGSTDNYVDDDDVDDEIIE
ncbi:hypothetical protein ACHHYP_16006 [Achlya hypogyna]|uniref:Secreted protein n=1 Tax=Achlya hypogyna TaxID=1202772 RepID=A0A0A7CPP5_ACHHY|nr:secreted protein [Achlya hypogyna]OQR96355.1 hypothetical protein ACHHYP_16006 [Achlya hypogyna]